MLRASRFIKKGTGVYMEMHLFVICQAKYFIEKRITKSALFFFFFFCLSCWDASAVETQNRRRL